MKCTRERESRSFVCLQVVRPSRMISNVRRLKNSEVRNLNDHRLNFNQEERTIDACTSRASIDRNSLPKFSCQKRNARQKL
ncbi:hypothetical protein Poly41_32450 [Novipirellula artificiosorum]|uniref:Uncharacterized protein n=1 Tax=Novipirellula artificiosorum TaxID=2528016 RepID=A0A5C6DK53_9BACT|nr:hypothetical protein Poly41_32450 [Novipirellula artificiosorum]